MVEKTLKALITELSKTARKQQSVFQSLFNQFLNFRTWGKSVMAGKASLAMGIERRIISYLESYGNTRETDLINYGVQNLGGSSERMKKVIDRMAIKGRIHRIVHSKLKPPEVYVTLEEPLPPEATAEREIANQEVERILEEAASLAEQIGEREHP